MIKIVPVIVSYHESFAREKENLKVSTSMIDFDMVDFEMLNVTKSCRLNELSLKIYIEIMEIF